MVREVFIYYTILLVALTLVSTRFTSKLNVIHVTLPIYVFAIIFVLSSPYLIDFTYSYILVFLMLLSVTLVNTYKFDKTPFLNYIYLLSFFTVTLAPYHYYGCRVFSTRCVYFSTSLNEANYLLFVISLIQLVLFNTVIYVNAKTWFNALIVTLFSLNNLIPLVLPTPSLWFKNILLIISAPTLIYVSKNIGRALFKEKSVDDVHDVYLLLNVPLVIVVVVILFIFA